MICNVLAAEFYPRTARGSATVVLNRIIDGHRSKVIGFNVASKREARQLAKQYGATPWNF
tara:strand:- start:739 stop:918 length:180 start_codon:yes stop_codon:yes gene_type:complete